MKKLIIILSVLLTVGIAYAGPTTLEVTEPVTNEDGSDLLDLTETVFYYRLSGDSNWTECDRKPATAPTGGGIVEGSCLITESYDGIVEFMAKAVDDVGNESDISEIVTADVDNQKPSAPACRIK